MFRTERLRVRLIGLLAALCWLPAAVRAVPTLAPEPAAPLQIYATVNPPAIVRGGGEQADGFMVELVALIQARLYVPTPAQIQIVPLVRGLAMVESEPNVLMVGMARTREREQSMHFVGPVFATTTGIYVLKSRAPQLRAMGKGIRSARAGARLGSAFVDIAHQNGFVVAEQPRTKDTAARLLMMSRVDVWVDSHDVVAAAAQQGGYPAEEIERLVAIGRMDTYLAFSAGTSEVTIQAWEDTLRAMKKDGSFQKLHRKWRPDLEPSPEVLHIFPSGASGASGAAGASVAKRAH